MKTFKEIRQYTGLSQAEFAKKYEIPKRTVESWEAKSESPSSRKCPSWYLLALERLVKIDFPKAQ